ncbi:GIY-YIG nuclease family protein [Candidatus Falkowbacteria bacterium]|nr:GIY-YIG nuclease family protein [Candidatus Falkowbacteria bacterium]
MYKVYILLCANLSFYVGYSRDLKRRLIEHNDKLGSFYLRSKLPVKLAYFENYKNKEEAIKRERQLKKRSKQKKINLIKFGHPGGQEKIVTKFK